MCKLYGAWRDIAAFLMEMRIVNDLMGKRIWAQHLLWDHLLAQDQLSKLIGEQTEPQCWDSPDYFSLQEL